MHLCGAVSENDEQPTQALHNAGEALFLDDRCKILISRRLSVSHEADELAELVLLLGPRVHAVEQGSCGVLGGEAA